MNLYHLSCFSGKTVFDSHERRKKTNENSVIDYGIARYVVEWHNVFSDFLKIYVKNGDITSKMLFIRFVGKEAFGDVSHVISTLRFRFKNASLSDCVPISLNEDKFIYFKKILTLFYSMQDVSHQVP